MAMGALALRLFASLLVATALALSPETPAFRNPIESPLTSATSPSPKPLSPSKQSVLNQIAADEAHARSLAQVPVPIVPGPPRFPPYDVDLSKYAQGVLTVFNYPCPSQFCLVTSAAQVVHDGYVTQVYAGADRPETAHGWLMVYILNPNHVTAPNWGLYRTAQNLGALHIDAITSETVRFSSLSGAHGTFRLMTREYE